MTFSDEQLLRLPKKKKKTAPFTFVLEALEEAKPYTKPMFGCLAIYVGPKIMLILRDKENDLNDNGIWVATSKEHHASLKEEFSHLRSIKIFGDKPTNWQVLPKDAPDFEAAATRACELILAGDPRIGRVPASKAPKKRKTKTKTKTSRAKAKKKAPSRPAKRKKKR